MHASKAEISVSKPRWHIKRLCKHFAHVVEAVYSRSGGFIDFQPGNCRIDAKRNKLVFNITAEEKQRIHFMKRVISMQVEKISEQNKPTWNWDEIEPAIKY